MAFRQARCRKVGLRGSSTDQNNSGRTSPGPREIDTSCRVDASDIGQPAGADSSRGQLDREGVCCSPIQCRADNLCGGFAAPQPPEIGDLVWLQLKVANDGEHRGIPVPEAGVAGSEEYGDRS